MDEPALFQRWMTNLEARHLANLRVSEVARALRALSSTYVERRDHALAGGQALDGAGKRAAFALYYGPLHYQLIRHVTQQLVSPAPSSGVLMDLGCGTGVAGAAMVAAMPRPLAVFAVDSHPWAVDEARQAYRVFGIDATVKRGDAVRARPPRNISVVVAAFVVNELDEAARANLLARLRDHAAGGAHVLIVEPMSRRVTPWWDTWATAFTAHGGRADEWKVALDPPPIVRQLGRAAGLTPDIIASRTLWLQPSDSPTR